MKYNKGLSNIVIISIIGGILIIIASITLFLLRDSSVSPDVVVNNNSSTENPIVVNKPNEKPIITDKPTEVVSSTVNTPDIKSEVCNIDSPSTIRVISPNGGDSFKAGEKMTVKWTSCNVDKNSISIMLMKQKKTVVFSGDENSVEAVYVGSDPTKGIADDGSEDITLPFADKSFEFGQYYFVSIKALGDKSKIGSGYTPRDYSDKLFTIK